MAQLVLPRVLALIVCDGIEESDQEIGVYRLTGVRSRLDVPVFPAFRPRLCVFVQMSGFDKNPPMRWFSRPSRRASRLQIRRSWSR